MTYVESYIDLYNQVKQSLSGGLHDNSIGLNTKRNQITETNTINQLPKEEPQASFSFTKGISHDINNMLSVITGYLELIKEEPGAEQNCLYIERAMEGAKALNELNRLLLTGTADTKICKNIKSIIDVIERSISVIVGVHRKITWNISIAPDTKYFKIKKVHLKRIIQNLAKNAVDAMPEGGEISVSLENTYLNQAISSAYPPGKYVKLSIKDNGSGIDESKLKNIFNSGFTAKENGNGLGLKITRYLVQFNSGYIDASSKSGSGTVFSLFFSAAGTPYF